jgi:hypothetical protein
MSRPPKKRKSPASFRTAEAGFPVELGAPFPDFDLPPDKFKKAAKEFLKPLNEGRAQTQRVTAIQYAMMDPMREFGGLPFLLRSVLFREPLEPCDIHCAGDLFVRILQLPAAPAERILKNVVSIMRNLEGEGLDRRCSALVAYHNYFTDHGEEPSKSKLKAYIVADRKRYKNMPDAGDGKGWTRLWKDSGLFEMPDR